MDIIQYFLFGDPSFNAQLAIVPAVLAAIISGASALANVIGQGVSNKKNRENVKESQQFQKDMYAQQLKDSLTYNSPQFKLSQLKQAGINPYLNSAFAGTEYSSSVPSTSTATNQSPDFSGFGDAANSFFQNKIAAKQLELMESQKDNVDADTDLKKKDADLKDVMISTQKVILENLPEQFRADLDIKWQTLENLGKEGNLTDATVRKTEQEINNLIAQEDLTKAETANVRETTAYIGRYYQLREREVVVAELNQQIAAYGVLLTERGIEVQEKLGDAEYANKTADTRLKEAMEALQRYRADHAFANETVPEYLTSAIHLGLGVLALRTGAFTKIKPIGFGKQ